MLSWSASLALWWPSSVGANRDPGSTEPVGDGLWVDAVSGGHRGEREPVGVQAGCVSESLAGPCRPRVVALDVVAVEHCGDGGPVDPVLVGEFVDRCAGAVGGDEDVDLGRGQASLDGV